MPNLPVTINWLSHKSEKYFVDMHNNYIFSNWIAKCV